MADKQNITPRVELTEDAIKARFNLSFVQSAKSEFNLEVDIALPGQGVTAIFGESGSGKTTLLRCIAGLENYASGYLSVNSDVWQDQTNSLPAHKRSLAYVFQEASLFEHLTVMANLRFAIKRSCLPVAPDLLSQVVQIMGIEHLLKQMPEQLSGGEKQRVAIARALLRQPKLLLMDEPLASLDTTRKRDILPYLEKLRRHFNIPILYVTHSLQEIAQLADYAVVLHQGKVIAEGEVTDLFSQSTLPLGVDNELGALIDCKWVEEDEKWQLMQLAFDGGSLWLPQANNNHQEIRRIRIFASDVSVTLSEPKNSSIVNVLPAKIVNITEEHSATCIISVLVGNTKLLARVTKKSVDKLQLQLDLAVWVQIKSAAIVR